MKPTLHTIPDPNPQSPRDWDNLGVMHCIHTKYHLGDAHLDKPFSEGEMRHAHGQDIVLLPLYLLDHSGLSLATTSFDHLYMGMDSGQVGWIMATAVDAARLLVTEEDGLEAIPNPAQVKEAIYILEQEVKVYNRFLAGTAYGFEVRDGDDDFVTLDSCWGFFDLESAEVAGSHALKGAELDWIKKTLWLEVVDNTLDTVIGCEECGDQFRVTYGVIDRDESGDISEDGYRMAWSVHEPECKAVMLTLRKRSGRIGKLLKQFYIDPETCSEEPVMDLLADVRHYCDSHDLAFGEVDKCAYRHYTQELLEAGGGRSS